MSSQVENFKKNFKQAKIGVNYCCKVDFFDVIIKRLKESVEFTYSNDNGEELRLLTVNLDNKHFDFGYCESEYISFISHSILLDTIVPVISEYLYNPPKTIEREIVVNTATELCDEICTGIAEYKDLPESPDKEVNLYFTRHCLHYIIKISDGRLRLKDENDYVLAAINYEGPYQLSVNPSYDDSVNIFANVIEFFLNAALMVR